MAAYSLRSLHRAGNCANFSVKPNYISKLSFSSFACSKGIQKTRGNIPFSGSKYTLVAACDISSLPSDYGKYAEPSGLHQFTQWFVDSSWINSVEGFLTTVHDVTGTSWWLSILICTFTMRCLIMTPLMVMQMKSSVTFHRGMPQLVQIGERLKEEIKAVGDKEGWDAATRLNQYQSNMRRHRKNLKIPGTFKRAVLPWIQIPLWFSISISLRELTMSLPYDARPTAEILSIASQFSNEGALWFPDLCIADPLFVLPVLFCTLNLAVIEIYRGDGKTKLKGIQKVLVYSARGLSIILLPIACQMPSGVVLYWTYSSLYGVTQALLLKSKKIKTLLGIRIAPSESLYPYKDLLQRLPIIKHMMK